MVVEDDVYVMAEVKPVLAAVGVGAVVLPAVTGDPSLLVEEMPVL